MSKCKKELCKKKTILGAMATIILVTAVGCGIKAVAVPKKPNFKKSAKKALKTVERYIDGIM